MKRFVLLCITGIFCGCAIEPEVKDTHVDIEVNVDLSVCEVIRPKPAGGDWWGHCRATEDSGPPATNVAEGGACCVSSQCQTGVCGCGACISIELMKLLGSAAGTVK